MKTIKLKFAIVVLVILTVSFFAFRTLQTGSVKGSVTPPTGAVRAWALSATDTFKANINAGAFEIREAKPGTYRVIIEAVKPYKNASLEDVLVAEGTPVDLGVIQLVRDSSGIK